MSNSHVPSPRATATGWGWWSVPRGHRKLISGDWRRYQRIVARMSIEVQTANCCVSSNPMRYLFPIARNGRAGGALLHILCSGQSWHIHTHAHSILVYLTSVAFDCVVWCMDSLSSVIFLTRKICRFTRSCETSCVTDSLLLSLYKRLLITQTNI